MTGRSDWSGLRPVLERFCLDGTPTGHDLLPGGHIHRNVLVTCPKARYVVQRVNDRIFSPVGLVLTTGERVSAHLAARGRRGPELVPTTTGALSLRDGEGSTWRCFRFLEGTVGRTVPTGTDDAYRAAAALADYVTAVSDLPGPPLVPAITPFHGLDHRLQGLGAVTHEDPVGRRSAVVDDIDHVRRLAAEIGDALSAVEARSGRGRTRTVHNDAKLANVRFAVDGRSGDCVIDLDTTMVGLVRYDVGEMVRTATTFAPEEGGATPVGYHLEMVAAVAGGYLSAGPDIDGADLESFALAGPEMAVENAVRFLTDYLDGDHYFSRQRPTENLERCRAQVRLAETLLAHQAETDASFRHVWRRLGRQERAPTIATSGP
ncbi:MAG: phosphotransferase [Acidimicrobiales bacterium]